MSKPIVFEWEKLSEGTYRAKVLGGWVLRDFDGESGNAMIFVPDPNHEWGVGE